MTLDRWFGKEIQNRLPQKRTVDVLTPPASNDETYAPKKPRPVHTVKYVGPSQARFDGHTQRFDRPDFLIRELEDFQETVPILVDDYISSMASSANKDLLALGLVNGKIELVNTDEKELVRSLKLFEEPQVSIHDTTIDGETLYAAALNCHTGIKSYDISSERVVREYGVQDDLNFLKVDVRDHQLVSCTSTGNIYVFDTRIAGEPVKRIRGAHADKKRGLPHRSVNAVARSGEHMLGSCSSNEAAVKFWDLRKVTRSVGKVAFQQQSRIGGVCDLVSDNSERIWALSKEGYVESFMPHVNHSIDLLPKRTVGKYEARLSIAQKQELVADYVLSGGSQRGIFASTLPSLTSSQNRMNLSASAELVTAEPGSEYFTSVHWHAPTEGFVASCGDMCYFWNAMES